MTTFVVLSTIAKMLEWISLTLIGAGAFLCLLIGIVFTTTCWRKHK